jgi:hypothetical protein
MKSRLKKKRLQKRNKLLKKFILATKRGMTEVSAGRLMPYSFSKLRGSVLLYEDPLSSIAAEEWEAGK